MSQATGQATQVWSVPDEVSPGGVVAADMVQLLSTSQVVGGGGIAAHWSLASGVWMTLAEQLEQLATQEGETGRAIHIGNEGWSLEQFHTKLTTAPDPIGSTWPEALARMDWMDSQHRYGRLCIEHAGARRWSMHAGVVADE